MGRSRNIKPGFFKNEDLAECSPFARLCFAGLWTLADREGRLEDRPRRIKGELFPFDTVDVEPLLQELARWKFILRYEVDGVRAIQILEFARHQSPHYSENPSVIKPPSLPESGGHDEGGKPENSGGAPPIKRGAQPPDSLIPDSLIPDTSSLREGVSRKRATPRQPKTAIPDDFGISDRVRRWATEKGFGRLDEHLAAFRRKCAAHGYAYRDHDAAFMEAIREDWAKLRRGPNAGAPPPDDAGSKAADDSARYLAEQAEHRRHATKPPATLLAIAGKAVRTAQ